MAHVNITGNPVPGLVWMFNGASARGDAVVSGQLTITNPTPADSGNYTNTLANTLNDGNTSSISNTIGLQVLSKYNYYTAFSFWSAQEFPVWFVHDLSTTCARLQLLVNNIVLRTLVHKLRNAQ